MDRAKVGVKAERHHIPTHRLTEPAGHAERLTEHIAGFDIIWLEAHGNQKGRGRSRPIPPSQQACAAPKVVLSRAGGRRWGCARFESLAEGGSFIAGRSCFQIVAVGFARALSIAASFQGVTQIVIRLGVQPGCPAEGGNRAVEVALVIQGQTETMGGINPVRLEVQRPLEGADSRRDFAVEIVGHPHVGLRFNQLRVYPQSPGIGFNRGFPAAPTQGVVAALHLFLDRGVGVGHGRGERRAGLAGSPASQPDKGEQPHQQCCGVAHGGHHTPQAREAKTGACPAWPAVIVSGARFTPMPPVETTASPPTLLLSLLVLLLSLGVLVPLVVVLLAAFQAAFGGFFERAAFRWAGLRCGQGDALVEQGDFAAAVRLFGEAFFLRPIRRDAELLSDIANYHTGLLSRLLTIADEMGKGVTHLPSLAAVDRLLAERLEMQLAYFRACKRQDSEQLRDSQERLKNNHKLTRLAINRLLDEIRSSPEERMQYH